jgi:hypothetical protein
MANIPLKTHNVFAQVTVHVVWTRATRSTVYDDVVNVSCRSQHREFAFAVGHLFATNEKHALRSRAFYAIHHFPRQGAHRVVSLEHSRKWRY